MTNDRKPLPEDDFVGNAAPFVLKITLEYPPRDTESLLGLTHLPLRLLPLTSTKSVYVTPTFTETACSSLPKNL